MKTSADLAVRMLILSDDEHLRMRLHDFFSKRTYRVASKEYDEGVQDGEVREYDVLLLDDELPEQKGFDFLSAHQQSTIPPKLMLVAGGRKDPVLEAFRLGAADCVTKPFYMEELGARVQAVLRRTLAYSSRGRKILAES